MNSTNNNNNEFKAEKEINQSKKSAKKVNPFSMDIKDDFYDPFNKDIFGFDLFEDKILRNFGNSLNDSGLLAQKPKSEKIEEENINDKKNEQKEEKALEEKEEEINTDSKKEESKEDINTNMEIEKEELSKKENKSEEKENKNNGTFYSKVYYNSYNNLNGEENEECYQSKSVKQMNDGIDISESREAYRNSNGIEKTAYQRGLNGKATRIIKEKNTKTGKHNHHKIIKGLEENEINGFNKEYNEFSKKCGLDKNFHNLDLFYPFGENKKLLGEKHFLMHKLLY